MLGRAGGAQGGYCMWKPQLRQSHHIHVAFGHQGITCFAQCRTCLKQTIQFAALAEHRRFGGIEVFGLFVAKHAPAKTNAFTLDVTDRKHDSVAKAVVTLLVLSVLSLQNDQAALHQQRFVVIGKNAGKGAPTLGRIAQAKLLGYGARQAASLKVVHRFGRFFEVFPVGFARLLQNIRQGVLLLPLLLGPRPVLRAGFVFWHLHPVLLGQVLNGLNKIHAGMVHQKADGVAILAAAKAMVKLLAGADREGGRFLPMKWAKPHEIGPAFLQLHVTADDVDHVSACQQLLNKGLGNGHGESGV